MQLLYGVFLIFAFGNTYVDAYPRSDAGFVARSSCLGYERNYGGQTTVSTLSGPRIAHRKENFNGCRNWWRDGRNFVIEVICMSGPDCHFYWAGGNAKPGWAGSADCTGIADWGKNLCLACGDKQYGSGTTCHNRYCHKGTKMCGTNYHTCCDCPKGQYQPHNWAQPTSCHNCPAGQYQDQTKQSGCKTCPQGMYQNSNGQHGCKNCPANTYRTDSSDRTHHDNVNDCLACPIHTGTYSTTSGTGNGASSNCYSTKCKKGYHLSGSGTSRTCIACTGDTYQPNDDSASTSCTAWETCPKGQYQNDGNTHTDATCSNCAAGTYQDTDDNSGDSTSCTMCPEGTYSSAGQETCDACSDGKQAQVTETIGIDEYVLDSAYHCITCEDGYDNTDGNKCDSCTNGQTSKAGAQCSTCAAGKQGQRVTTIGINNYVATTAFECVTCEYGYDNTDGEQCDACTNGQISKDGDTCSTCPAGQQGQRVTAIGIGNYVESTAFECVTCQDGYDNTDGEQCDACIAGKYSVNGDTCATCDPGSVTDTLHLVGASICTPCDAGTYTPDSTIACLNCPPGSVTNTLASTGATTCTECPPGKWTGDSREACKAWTICDPGYFLVGHSSSQDGVCTICPDGSYCPGGSSYSSTDLDYPGIQMYCAPDYEGIDGVAIRSSHSNSCQECPAGFTGKKYITERTSGLGDESMLPAECETYANSLGKSFEIGDYSDKPWGCFEDYDGKMYYNQRIYNTNVQCSEDVTCYQHAADQGTDDCSECPLGSWEIDGVCNPWQFSDQTECPEGAAFVTGSSSMTSTCITDFIYEPDDPSDGTLDLTTESIVCGELNALVDPQGIIRCSACNRQQFLAIYRGPIVTTDNALKRGSCCVNSHHHVCIKMMDEFRLKCGMDDTKAVNQCV